MEDFTLNTSNESHVSEELSLQVSAICERDGQKMAYVTFSDDTRHAEGEIPACIITKSHGFTESEVLDLQQYMLANLDQLKKMASKVNIMDAFLGRTPQE
jgi:chorismate mutase